jgi:hypothetical protein
MVGISSSGSSGMDVDIRGSDMGPCKTEVVSEAVSPASLFVSLTAVLRRRLTTLFFFLRPALACFPDPSDKPVIAEFRLTRDGLEGK